jgi:uncharacterized protein YggE
VLSNTRRVWLVLAGLALVGGLVLVAFAPGLVAAQTTEPTVTGRTITVVGSGQVSAKPDIATVNLGVDVTAPTVSDAKDQADELMQAIIAALRDAGIADRDIQTSNYSISFERQTPDVTPQEGQQTPAGVYRGSNTVRVTVRDLDTVGDIIDTAVSAGANNVWGVSFGLENTDALEQQAREEAVADARARAESLAKLNGVTVGDVLHISEVVGATPGPVYAEVAPAAFRGAPVEAGEMTYSTQIQVIYAMQ